MSEMMPLGAALQREELSCFLMSVFRTLHPGASPLVLAWYLRAICHALQSLSSQSAQRLVISVPPRHLKSITASVAWVAWLLGRDPTLKVIVTTYSAELGREHAEACRQVMMSAWYQSLFPATRISPSNNRQHDFRTTAGGGRRSVSVLGSATGFGGDVIILDDCMKASEISSEAARTALKVWYTGTLLTRLNSKKAGNIVSIQQRLGEDDLTALLLDQGFRHLCLPAIGERNEIIPIGLGRVYPRQIGELLDATREDEATLARLRRELGAAVFGAQYQQNPVALGGHLIQIAWFLRCEEPPRRDECTGVIQSWDTAMSASPTSDFSACLTMGYCEGHWYVLDVFRERLDYPDLKRAMQRLARQWRPDRVLVEKANAGISLGQELWAERQRGIHHGFVPILWQALTSKVDRLTGQTGQLEAGLVVLPNDAPWLDVLTNECRAFPNGRHDDLVDCLSQFLDYIMGKPQMCKKLRDGESIRWPSTGRQAGGR